MSDIIPFPDKNQIKDIQQGLDTSSKEDGTAWLKTTMSYQPLPPYINPPIYPYLCECHRPSMFEEYINSLPDIQANILCLLMICNWNNEKKEKDCNSCKCKDICGVILKSIIEECEKKYDKTM